MSIFCPNLFINSEQIVYDEQIYTNIWDENAIQEEEHKMRILSRLYRNDKHGNYLKLGEWQIIANIYECQHAKFQIQWNFYRLSLDIYEMLNI